MPALHRHRTQAEAARRPAAQAPTRLMAAALALLLAGCESMPGGTAVADHLKKAFVAAAQADGATRTAAAPGATGAAQAGSGEFAKNPLEGTELDKIFQKKPITNTNRPERWPRVALTVKAVTPGVHTLSGQGTLRDSDCITFDARLWRSASDSQKFENLRLCTPAVQTLSKGVAYRTLELFPRFTVPGGENSTANQRTEGPTQPFYMSPQDIKTQQQWFMGPWNNKFYLGALLVALGYDWDNDFDRRLWVVSLPLPG
jgi:hypothetical protein